MANRRKPWQLNAPKIFFLAALVGAVVALLIQFATILTPSSAIPGIDDSRLVHARIDITNDIGTAELKREDINAEKTPQYLAERM